MQAAADDEECRAVFREQQPSRDMSVLGGNPDEQFRLVRVIYKSRLGRHIGITKTVARLKQQGYDFPGLRKRVEEVLAVYDICRRGKPDRHKPYGLLQPLPVAERL